MRVGVDDVALPCSPPPPRPPPLIRTIPYTAASLASWPSFPLPHLPRPTSSMESLFFNVSVSHPMSHPHAPYPHRSLHPFDPPPHIPSIFNLPPLLCLHPFLPSTQSSLTPASSKASSVDTRTPFSLSPTTTTSPSASRLKVRCANTLLSHPIFPALTRSMGIVRGRLASLLSQSSSRTTRVAEAIVLWTPRMHTPIT